MQDDYIRFVIPFKEEWQILLRLIWGEMCLLAIWKYEW